MALFLFGILAIAITPLFLSGTKSNEAADEAARATGLARERLEDLLAIDFRHPRLATGAHEDVLPESLPSPVTGAHPSPAANPFVRRYRVLQFAGPPDASVPPGTAFVPVRVRGAGSRYDFKRIDVTVEARLRRAELGMLAVRISAIRPNPAPDAILSEPDADP